MLKRHIVHSVLFRPRDTSKTGWPFYYNVTIAQLLGNKNYMINFYAKNKF
jgi:hypothetical protein